MIMIVILLIGVVFFIFYKNEIRNFLFTALIIFVIVKFGPTIFKGMSGNKPQKLKNSDSSKSKYDDGDEDDDDDEFI